MKHLLLLLTLLLTLPFSEAEFHKYSQLLMKNYDEMESMVQAKISAAKAEYHRLDRKGDTNLAEQKAVALLREAMRLLLSRPDKSDENMVDKLFRKVEPQLRIYNSFNDTLESLLDSSILASKRKNRPIDLRATDLFIIENIMSEMQPRLTNTDKNIKDFAIKIYKKICDAKIEISQDMRNNRLGSMFKTKSPSKTAEKILKDKGIKD